MGKSQPKAGREGGQYARIADTEDPIEDNPPFREGSIERNGGYGGDDDFEGRTAPKASTLVSTQLVSTDGDSTHSDRGGRGEEAAVGGGRGDLYEDSGGGGGGGYGKVSYGVASGGGDTALLGWRSRASDLVSSPASLRLRRFATTNALPDESGSYAICNTVNVVDGSPAVKLLKFAVITLLAICSVHQIIRFVDWEHDSNYDLSDFVLYDLNYVLLDIPFFFVVGRLHDRGGFDRLWPCLAPMSIGCVYNSWSSEFRFLRYSASAYEVVCLWPWTTYAYALGCALLAAGVVALHVRRHRRDGVLLSRLLELAILAGLFIGPYASHPNFHLHHWYFSWLVGMQFNSDAWWSLASLAFMWGQYVNGVAAWGRDPLLTCAYSYYMSTDIRCPYMSCYFEKDKDTGEDHYKAFVAPDWRNCSATDNYIP